MTRGPAGVGEHHRYFTSVRDPVVGVVSVVGSPCSGHALGAGCKPALPRALDAGSRARRRLQTYATGRARRRLQTNASRALGAGLQTYATVGCKARATGRVQGAGLQTYATSTGSALGGSYWASIGTKRCCCNSERFRAQNSCTRYGYRSRQFALHV